MLKIYIFTHSGGAEVALGEIPETVGGFGDFLYCITEVTDHFVPLLLLTRITFFTNFLTVSTFFIKYKVKESTGITINNS